MKKCNARGSAARDPHGIKQITVGPPHGIKQITMFIREMWSRTNSVNVIVEPLPIGLGLNNCIRVDPWSRLSIPEGRKLFLVGDLRLSHPINKQTVTIWVSVNLSSPLSLRKNLVVLALYQYSRPSPLSEADNIANPRGGVANWRPTRGLLC
ncbi:hypothetical protein J6590_053072 [Homalodisca vitripennis]|nr:hypothetical protein J6590_053072 [Homalodisca vitripennis]